MVPASGAVTSFGVSTMPKATPDPVREIVLEVVELNCDPERNPTIDAATVARTLGGSEVSESEVESALAALVASGALVASDGGVRPAE